MRKKIIPIIMVMSMLLILFSMHVFADGTGDFTVTTEVNDGYSYASNVLTISNGGSYTISGTTTSDRIDVAASDDVTITLSGVSITSSSAPPLDITGSGNVTIVLSGTNTLTSTAVKYAGLQKTTTGNTLTITSESGDGSSDGSLTATGCGTTSGSGGAAGIGGGLGKSGSNIIINGGTVTATGGNSAAGIGGGNGESGTNITISGGTVTATGGADGAAIGGGCAAEGNSITISGGTVTASAIEDQYGNIGGAAIGGGYKGSGSNISISGGYVKLSGESYMYIGGGSDGSSTNISITGGCFADSNATKGYYGTCKIYGLDVAQHYMVIDNTDSSTSGTYMYTVTYSYVNCGELVINDYSDEYTGITYDSTSRLATISGAGTYTVSMADGVTITKYDRIEVIKEAEVTLILNGINIDLSAYSTENTGISPISLREAGACTITLADGTTNTLIAGSHKEGILLPSGDQVTFNGTGSLDVTGGTNAAGIGGVATEHIVIEEGTITANGGSYAAGIGGSNYVASGKIEIIGGTVTATGGNSAAGIGGGDAGNGDNITISGGTVVATGGYHAAGIGGGYLGSGSNITISGGTVTATGGDATTGVDDEAAAGIGGGTGGDGNSIEISGGMIVAAGGEEGAAIGGGYGGSADGITISGGRITAHNGTSIESTYSIDAAGIGAGKNGSATDINISGGYIILTSEVATIGVTTGDNTGVSITGGCFGDDNAIKGAGGQVYGVEVGDGYTVYGNSDQYYGGIYEFFVSNDSQFTVTKDGKDYTPAYGYGGSGSEKTLILMDEGDYVVSMADGVEKVENERITVATDYDMTITLSDVYIESSTGSPLNIKDDEFGGGNVTIYLSGTNTLISTAETYAGIQTTSTTKSYIITSADGDGSTNGSLIVSGGTSAAAIGGGMGADKIAEDLTGDETDDALDITISGGTITATGGTNAAAIGGGDGGSGIGITISGGIITATGGTNAAVIGGGQNSAGDNITISDGYFSLTSGTDGTYIGNGSGVSSNNTILISGGYFAVGDTTAKTVYGIAVEDGYEVSDNEDLSTKSNYPYVVVGDPTDVVCGDLIVHGLEGRYEYSTDTHVVNISHGGEFTVSMAAAGSVTTNDRIVVSTDSDVTITLSGISIESSSAAPIEITGSGDVTLVLENDNTLTSTSGYYAALQKAAPTAVPTSEPTPTPTVAPEGMLTITSASGDGNTDGTLTATGYGEYVDSAYHGSAGIGGGDGEDGSYITINGGTVTAIGGLSAAGIGGGYNGDGSYITINGGEVNVSGGLSGSTTGSGLYGAGIGGGYYGSADNITITAGTINAVGGNYAAAIGGGRLGSLDTLTISGGYITASAGGNSTYSIGRGTGSGTTMTNVSITGGYYGAGNTDANTVYGVDVADGYMVFDNEDEDSPYANIVAAKCNFELDEESGYEFNYDTRILTITSGGDYTVKMYEGLSSTTTDSIVIDTSSSVTLTLSDVDVEIDSRAPIEIVGSGAVTIYISGTNVLETTAEDYAGIQKTNTGSSLTITNLDGENEGILKVAGGSNAADIGGGNEGQGTNITISGGYIYAGGSSSKIGGDSSSVIGSGKNGSKATGINIIGGAFNSSSAYSSEGKEGTVYNTTVADDYCVFENSDSIYGNDYPFFVSTISDFTVSTSVISGYGHGYTGSGINKTLIISKGGEYTVTMSDSGSTTYTDRILITSENEVTITLSGVSIANETSSPFYITGTGNVILKLSDTNTITSTAAGFAGIQKNLTGNKLTIENADENYPGYLIVTGGYQAAGIGGGYGSNCANIIINSGYITATGGDQAAAIGGGYSGTCSYITITGGYIIATKGTNATGIGGGFNCGTSAMYMSITGGYYGAADTNHNTVYDAYVATGYSVVENTDTTTSDTYPYVITEKTDEQECGDLIVSGPSGSFNYASKVVSITGGGDFTVTMADNTEETTENRILVASSDDVTITLYNVIISSETSSPINITGDGDVTIILHGTNKLTSTAEDYAGLQKKSTVGTLTITSIYGDGDGGIKEDGAYLYAVGGTNASGIGGGSNGAGKNIVINGGYIDVNGASDGYTSTGSKYGAGIGGGIYAEGSDITINGGWVTVNGGSTHGAGIGGGEYGAGSNITFNGGYIDARGGDQAAGIGGGYESAGSNIVIGNATVVAWGGTNGAGIGGGYAATGSNITISGGSVNVTSGYAAACIGGGTDGDGYDITISGGSIDLTHIDGDISPGEYIGHGYSSLDKATSEYITITGGSFADSDASIGESGKVYDVSVASGYQVIANPNSEESDYPYIVTANVVETECGDLVVSGIKGWYSYNEATGLVTISKSGEYTVSMKESGGSTTSERIAVTTTSGDVTITLNGVDISSSSASPFEITGSANVTIVLSGDNTLTSTADEYAGLQKTDTSTLTITSTSGDGSTDGSLTATGGANAAGIGGGAQGNGSNITISGATITSTGGSTGGAGIGGGLQGTGSSITISGGTITANGGSTGGAGIGGGLQGTGSNITISDGTITANGGSIGGAGIGGGYDGVGSDITISGGNITLTCGTDAAYIGSGYGGSKATGITISGGSFGAGSADESTVYEVSVADGCYVSVSGDSDTKSTYPYFVSDMTSSLVVSTEVENGHGYYIDDDSSFVLNIFEGGEYEISLVDGVTITNVDRIRVTASSDVTVTLHGVCIASATASAFEINSSGTVTIKLDGASTLKSSAVNYAGLQKTSTDNKLIITSAAGDGSTSGSLVAVGGGNGVADGTASGAGIGGASGCVGNNIEISGGTVTATGGENAAGIGGGYNASGTNITISGGAVRATSPDAAGIGGGYGADGSKITISGGTVTAFSSEQGAGIGGGYNGVGSEITVNGGTVTATGGDDGGAAIGGGYNSGDVKSTGSDITISGGTVTAIGGEYGGAAIGGGYNGTGSGITITGGTIEADGGSYTDDAEYSGAGIGGGYKGAGSDITISNGTVTASGGWYAAGIGGGSNGAGSAIKITGGIVNSTGGTYYGAAIGGGRNGEGSDITITDGYISLDRGQLSALSDYIGNGQGGATSENVKISGGYFADEDGETDVNVVYKITVVSGYEVVDNDDDSTKDAYPYVVQAAPAFVISSGTEGGYTYDDDLLEITSGGEYTISMNTLSGVTSTTTERISVTASDAVTLILNGVCIDLSASTKASPIDLSSAGECVITLADGTENTLKAAGEDHPGIYVPSGVQVTFDGTGTLDVSGGYLAAGIGGSSTKVNGTVIITDGTINVNGGGYGAAIGGGYDAGGGNITISGGTVTANGGESAAAIGGGYGADGSNVTISGGIVTANGGESAAAIGGGYYGSADNITISDGYLTLTHGNGAAFIGCGNEGVSATNISITGGYFGTGNKDANTVYEIAVPNGYEVIANDDITTSDAYPYMVSKITYEFAIETNVENGYTYDNNILKITSGGEYTISMNTAQEITNATTDKILISSDDDVTITLSSVIIESDSASPFEINSTGDVTILLSGDNTLKSTSTDTDGSQTSAGLQKTSTDNNLIIENADDENPGSLTVTGGSNGAGIGGGYKGTGSNITINSGTIKATGGAYSAGIGGGGPNGTSISSYGYGGAGSNITINGGTVTATGNEAAGIGGGRQGNGSNISIIGGTVKAHGGYDASAIGGGGNQDTGSDIAISGGYITASSSGTPVSLIGAGLNGTVSNISITGGYFGAGDTEGNTVYGISVVSGCEVLENTDSETYGSYPVYVLCGVTFGAQETDSGVYYSGDDVNGDLFGVIRFLQEYTGTYSAVDEYGFYFLESENGSIIKSMSVYNTEQEAINGFYGDVTEIAETNYDDPVYAKAFVVVDGVYYYSDVFSGTVGSNPKLVSDPTMTE